MEYVGNCTHLDGDDISLMVDEAEDVTRDEFVAAVGSDVLAEVESNLGYPMGDLTMAKDWHVTYHRGKYQYRPCFFFCHSCIEYVFV